MDIERNQKVRNIKRYQDLKEVLVWGEKNLTKEKLESLINVLYLRSIKKTKR